MLPISIRNLVERVKLFSSKRIKSPNIKNEVSNENVVADKQINNSNYTEVNNYYERKKDEMADKPTHEELNAQRQRIPLDTTAFSPIASGIWNKVF